MNQYYSVHWLPLPLPCIHGSVRLSTVKTTDISPLSVSPWVSSGPLALHSTMGQQGGKPGVLAEDTSPEQGGCEPFLIPALFFGRLTLLNRHRVNQHISLYPSRTSIGQYAGSIIICVCVFRCTLLCELQSNNPTFIKMTAQGTVEEACLR